MCCQERCYGLSKRFSGSWVLDAQRHGASLHLNLAIGCAERGWHWAPGSNGWLAAAYAVTKQVS